MRLLLNQGLPRSAVGLLSQDGHDTVHVSQIGLAEAPDAGIIAEAKRSGRVVVTLDADYHRLIATAQASSPSVIRIRVEGLRAEPLCRLLAGVLRQCASALEAGSLVTVEPHRVRVRRLPLSGR